MAAKPSIFLLSLGDMGSGVTKLLTSHDYSVYTSLAGRSSHTAARAQKAGAQTLTSDSDVELLLKTDIFISIVPPRDAISTARRIRTAWEESGGQAAREKAGRSKLWYLDLNAVSPATAREVGAALGIHGDLKELYYNSKPLNSSSSGQSVTEDIIFLDGGIIGAPPCLDGAGQWSKPSIPTSGPHALASFPSHGEELASILRIRHISPIIGPATGLKMCFASLSKGFAALALQSFSTAESLGVLPELQRELEERVPAVKTRAENAITSCPPKAYRWVHEMEEIGRCFGTDGGWENGHIGSGGGYANVFGKIAQVYEFMADETALGQEKIGERKCGQTAEDVAGILAEALRKKSETQ